MKKFLFAILTLALVLCLLPALSQPAAATEVTEATQVDTVRINTDYPALGQEISELTATVSTGAVLEDILVYDLYTGEEITEGPFVTGQRYQLQYIVVAAEGYQFPETLTLVYNGGYSTVTCESENRLVHKRAFITCTYFENAYLNMPLLQVGMGVEDIAISCPTDATYYTTDIHLVDKADGTPVTGKLQPDKTYQLQVTLVANHGYVFDSRDVYVYLNDAKMIVKRSQDGTSCLCTFNFTPVLDEVKINSLPQNIRAGYKAGTPSVYPSNRLQISAVNQRWLDSEMQEYTDVIQPDETYYLAFDLQVIGAGGAWENLIVDTGDREATVNIIDSTHAAVLIPYTPLRQICSIRMLTQGIEQGKPVTGVSASAEENVVITYTGATCDSKGVPGGVFEVGKIYYIGFKIAPAEGYYMDTIRMTLEVDGQEHKWTNQTDCITFSIRLDTRILIKTAKLNISGVGVGKNIAKVKLTEASGSKFEIFHKAWSATDTSGTKFKKGERYHLAIALDAEDGYRFSTDTVITVGGKKAFDISTGFSGDYLYGTYEIEYITELTSVKLPAMPKSIQLGATLPTNFKVSSSAKYTMEPVWLSMSNQQQAVIANKNDCYVLSYVVYAKDGCEFTADTVFYVDGKKVKPVALSYYAAQIMKPYNVGLTEIERIDLTVTEPADGMKPETVTTPTGAPYTLLQQAWLYNTTGDPEDSTSSVTTFQNYKYHFLVAELQTKTGYMFADKVSLYINGIKYSVLNAYNLGTAYQLAVSFGKLGEIPKLTAPEVAKEGFALSWEPVRNADGYEVYRATSKSGSYTKVVTVTETTWSDVPVKGKTYYYKVKAIFTPDTTRNSGYSAVVSIAYKCDAPVITVENGSAGKPVISWEKVSGAKKYTVYRATSETGKYKKLGTTTKLTYTDSKAKTGTTYFYKVIANASSSTYNSSYSNIVSCNVICGTPSVTIKVDTATGKPVLSWEKIDAAAGYRILRQLPGEEDFTVISEQTTLAFKDTTAPIDTLCKYRVQTLGKSEALHGSLTKVLEIASGIARPSLQTSIDASGKPELRWQTVEGAVKYEVYRSTKSSKGYSLLTTVEAPGYTDESVAPGKTYYYKVVAVGAVSKSTESSYAKLSGKCATPEITAEVDYFSGKPVISWEKVSGAKKYTVYRATSETGKYKKLGTTTKLTYTDTKATVATTYYYKIVANASSSKYNSGYSNLVSCTPTCAVPVIKAATAAATGKPVLSWKKVTGAVRYEIWLEQAGAKELLAETTKLTFTDESIAPGEAKIYWVYAVDALGERAGEWVVATATCPQPKLKGKVGTTGKPEITWTEVEGATSYIVYRSTSSSSKKFKEYAVELTVTDGTVSFTDTAATKGKTYYYKVVAVCEDTQSAISSYVKVKSK